MKEVLKILQNYKFVKKEFYILLFTWFFYQIITILYPKITQYLISVIENKKWIDELYFWIWILAVYTIVYSLSRLLYDFYWTKVWLYLFEKKQILYQWKIIDKNYKDIEDLWTWKLLARLESWVQWEVEIFTKILAILVEVVFWWLIILWILYFYIPSLIFIVLFWIIILSISNHFLRRYISKYTKKEQEFWEEFWKNKARVIMSNLIIKLFWKKDLELWKSKISLRWWRDCWIKVDMANEIYYKLIDWLIRFIEIWAFLIIWYLIIKDWAYPISFLIMIIWYIWFLRTPIDKTISNLNHINKVWEKYKKLQEFIEKPNDIKNWTEDFIYKKWEIKIKNLDFSYWNWDWENNLDEKNIFKNFSLKFLAWKKNALVWHSWWGKSSIVKILLRLYDYQKWEILVDWQDLRKIKIETFYDSIWYLPQDPAVFDWTIRENLEYAFPDNCNLSKEEKEKLIRDSLKKSRIDKMIKWLKNWLNSEIWEKWVKLSWWEKQRLAIARIFLKDPKIIILDEPTSALDSISEAKITESLNELIKNKTSVIIAHRLQTVMNSDNIVVIEDWKIESNWSHDELLKKSKVYKKLVDLQKWEINE